MILHGEADLGLYRQERIDFFRQCGGKWDQALSDPFDVLAPLPLTRAELSDITSAAMATSRIYRRMLGFLCQASDQLLVEMGVPRSATGLVRLHAAAPEFPFLSRIDMARTPDGYKVLELNAEAPGLLVETFPLNALINARLERHDPNERGGLRLGRGINRSIRRAAKYLVTDQDTVTSAFCSYRRYRRDSEIAAYMCGLVDSPARDNAICLPVEDLRFDRGGIFDPRGRKIDIVFRMFPLAVILRPDCSPLDRDTPLVTASQLRELITARKACLINPLCSIALESKAVMAIIWGLRGDRRLFAPWQQHLVERYFIPTYLDPPETSRRYVSKPMFGWNGDTVAVVDRLGQRSMASADTTYLGRDTVFQEFIELPELMAMTELGPASLQLVVSCFLIDGVPSGVIVRAGHGITNFDWWVVPVTGSP